MMMVMMVMMVMSRRMISYNTQTIADTFEGRIFDSPRAGVMEDMVFYSRFGQTCEV